MPRKPDTYRPSWRGSPKPTTSKPKRERCRLYDTARWRTRRLAFLAANPLCDECLAMVPSRVVAATVVDHHVAHKGDAALFFDESNWRAKCKPHHDAKTARQDGGFGNERKERRVIGCDENGFPLGGWPGDK